VLPTGSVPADDLLLAAVYIPADGGAALPDISEGDIYVVYQRTNSVLTSYTLDVADQALGEIRGFLGSKVNTATYTFAKESELTAAVEFWSASVDTNRTLQAFAPAEENVYTYFEGRISRDSTVIALVDSADIVVNNNLERGNPVNDQSSPKRSSRYIVSTSRRYTTSLTLDFASFAQYELFLGAIGATEPQDTFSQVDLNYRFLKSNIDKIEFTIPDAVFDATNIQPAVEALIKQELTPLIKTVRVDCWDSQNAYPTANPNV